MDEAGWRKAGGGVLLRTSWWRETGGEECKLTGRGDSREESRERSFSPPFSAASSGPMLSETGMVASEDGSTGIDMATCDVGRGGRESWQTGGIGGGRVGSWIGGAGREGSRRVDMTGRFSAVGADLRVGFSLRN